ncbi:MAG TPA: hypothetical protein VF487_08685 [Chitinophagaceae bacterium]
MKSIYIISFLADMAVLVFLCYLFLSEIDKGVSISAEIATAAGIVISIVLLVFCLYKYDKWHRQQL